MSNTRHQNFRSFLTERFTTVAVEVFQEVETIVEAYYEENKRLRNLLHAVFNPEIKLQRIDAAAGQNTGATADVREQPPKRNTQVDLKISEPLPKKPKEEQVEYNISWESQQQEGLGGADTLINPDCVKSDPEEEEDSNMLSLTDSYDIKVMEWNPESSATVSADEANDDHKDNLSLDSDGILFSDEENASESGEPQNDETKWMKEEQEMDENSKHSLQKTMLEWPRMTPLKSVIAAPADSQSFLARLTEAFKDFPNDKKPLITKMGLAAEVELVDCAFGKVLKGSPLSFQCPLPSSQDYKTNVDAPPRPMLPRFYHKLEPKLALPTLSSKEQELVNTMQVTWEEAHSIERSTRGQESVEKLRRLRLTSHFMAICKLKPIRSHAERLAFKIQKGSQRYKIGEIYKEMTSEALRAYCRNLCVNWYPCGLIVHPNAPWLGALPDGLVYDPDEKFRFGLVHVKCVSMQSFIDCAFLHCKNAVLQLRKSHSYYWNIQAEMMIAGMSWCDLLVCSREDILVQRIYRDEAIIDIMKDKLGDFFFHFYLPSLILTGVTS